AMFNRKRTPSFAPRAARIVRTELAMRPSLPMTLPTSFIATCSRSTVSAADVSASTRTTRSSFTRVWTILVKSGCAWSTGLACSEVITGLYGFLQSATDGVDVEADRENGATTIVAVAPADRRVFRNVAYF